MRIFIAGATGAVGTQLVPLLVSQGHQVTGTTRARPSAIEALGAEAVRLDALDRVAVAEAIDKADPDVVVHQLTAIQGPPNLRRFDDYFAATNRLRTEGTDNLIAALNGRRFVAQSYTGWPNERTGSLVKTEEGRIDPHPTRRSRETLAAIRHLEDAVGAVHGVALRYGGLYGPGTALAPGGEMLEMIRKRRFPVVGGGTGIMSHIHIADAARATVLAIEGDVAGVFNIVDDEPAPVHEWLPYIAEVIGAKPPPRVPAWLVRPLLGEHGISLMTKVRGSSNAKAKRELGWTLRCPSWRHGFREGL